jgi:alkylhydroperoxidase family enzyme
MSKLIPRLQMEQLPPDLAAALQPKVQRLKYLGEFFQCMGHQPKALLSFHTLTDDLKEALPDNLTEVVALTVAGIMENHYERHQHERLSVKLGFDRQWVREVNALAPDKAQLMREDERLAQKFAMAVVNRRGHGVEQEFDAVVRAVGAPHAAAIIMLVGRYVMHALIANALALKPPVPSIFEEKQA